MSDIMSDMEIDRIMLDEARIAGRVKELAARISADYRGKNLLAVGILKGAFMFFADLIRLIDVPLSVDFIVSSSYAGTRTTGDVKVYYEIRTPVADMDVLLIEDIVDTGISLKYLRERLLRMSPKSLKICTLLDKKERRIVEVPVDYNGFEIPDEFVVGYGIDYNDRFRNLPYIAVVKKS
jgi:hypoxanthine phosphoribosyltransferase